MELEDGYYWVIYDLPGDWEPAQYYDGCWNFIGSTVDVEKVDKIGPKLLAPHIIKEL